MGSVIIEPNRVLVEPNLWTIDDQSQAINEGWYILLGRWGNASRGFAACVLIAPQTPRFATDAQAREFVYARAAQGSPLHQRAVVALTKARLHGLK